MCAATSEVLWLINVLKELHINVMLPIDIFCDNNTAISIAASPIFHDRTKHFEIDLFFLREKISAGVIKTISIESGNQPADIFTKGLDVYQHDSLIKKLNMHDVFGL
uniref:Uncharacterized protein n=1 Tax=Helianthus annuus TaxID=4232 RepID=A0A251S0V3_HELAN